MSRAEAILATLLVYMGVMLAIGVWASRRTRDETDFLLGGRKLGAWVAALSASAASPSPRPSPSTTLPRSICASP